ncbi:MAG: hypothetical protein LBH00_10510 [Planctomycetaceae bacterium]|jgi:hypothetical protein|nr:hypothetical protein [Planctomycetaceae bacterium]
MPNNDILDNYKAWRNKAEIDYFAPLNQAQITTDKGIAISIQTTNDNLPQVLIKQKPGRITQQQRHNGLLELDENYITTDYNKLFPILFEAIYQVRNSLIHGSMEPHDENHNVVKYCYFILWELLM